MIEAKGVSKRYDAHVALSDVSFKIGSGEVVGLLGPNGAGKTTLIRILTGYFEPSDGSVTVDGLDVEASPSAVQARIGYLPEQTPLYPEMLVQEYLEMCADVRQLVGPERTRLLAEAVWATGLEQHLIKPIATLSKGFRQRVGLAQAILHRPKVLILDEPTSGLDPTQVVQVRELIARLAQSTTVLFSTHILSEVEQICQRAIILLGGRVRADARLDELKKSHSAVLALAEDRPGGALVGTAATVPDLVRQLSTMPSVRDVKRIDGRAGYATLEVVGSTRVSETDLCRELFRFARDKNVELGELRPVVRDLETVFRDLVRAEAAATSPTQVGGAP